MFSNTPCDSGVTQNSLLTGRYPCVFCWLFRACLVMAQLLEDSSFCEEFIQQCPAAVEVLNLVAQECSPGENAFWHLHI